MLTSITEIKREGNLPDTIDNKVLETHLTKAVIEMKKILSETKYDEIKMLGAGDGSYTACSIAEANLALSYVLPSLNIETQGNGIVRTKGWDQSRSDLLSQNEINTLCERYRDVAMDLLKPYIPQAVVTADTPVDEVRGANYRLSAL